jgi:hypothetical protein
VEETRTEEILVNNEYRWTEKYSRNKQTKNKRNNGRIKLKGVRDIKSEKVSLTVNTAQHGGDHHYSHEPSLTVS